MNLGMMFLTLVVILLVPAWIICTKPCKNKSRWLTRKHSSLTKALHGNIFMRFLL